MSLKTRLLLLILLSTLIFQSQSLAVQGHKSSEKDTDYQWVYSEGDDPKDRKHPIRIKVKIKEAFYADLDNDEDEDDIRLKIEIKFSGVKKHELKKEGLEFTLFFSLELPSGLLYEYEIEGETNKKEVTYKIDLLNHATEAGYYIATAFVIVEETYFEKYPVETVRFDPPGGTSGDDPTMRFFRS